MRTYTLTYERANFLTAIVVLSIFIDKIIDNIVAL